MPRNERAKLQLTDEQVESFVENGFVCIPEAFRRETATQAREILWRATGCDPNDRATWTRPVVRLGGYTDPPFKDAANAPSLIAAFDQLVGAGRWLPREGLGTFPVRFPSDDDPADTGWHVDASYPPPGGAADKTIFQWRVNIFSRDRALLMLFLFSDVTKCDAPTRIRVGSHFDVARILAQTGENGMSVMQLAQRLDESSGRPEVVATGKAGTVYLCHPFLVHAAQPHRGTAPRFLAQPPLGTREPIRLERGDGDYSPVERAVRRALDLRK